MAVLPSAFCPLPSTRGAHAPRGGDTGHKGKHKPREASRLPDQAGEPVGNLAGGMPAGVPHATVPRNSCPLTLHPPRWHRTQYNLLQSHFPGSKTGRSSAALMQEVSAPLREEGEGGAFPCGSLLGGTRPGENDTEKATIEPHALPRPWLSSEAESGTQTQLPRAGSWGPGNFLRRLRRRPGSNHCPGTHLSRGCAPAPPGRRLLPLPGLGPEQSLRWPGNPWPSFPRPGACSGERETPCPALVGKRLSAHCSPAGTLQGSSLCPGRGVSAEWGAGFLLVHNTQLDNVITISDSLGLSPPIGWLQRGQSMPKPQGNFLRPEGERL